MEAKPHYHFHCLAYHFPHIGSLYDDVTKKVVLRGVADLPDLLIIESRG
jgi:hypothetical protein